MQNLLPPKNLLKLNEFDISMLRSSKSQATEFRFGFLPYTKVGTQLLGV
jgi:hypothetical protein